MRADPICDCDARGRSGWPPVARAGSAAGYFSVTAAPLTRRMLLGSAFAATAVALASPAAAQCTPNVVRGQDLRSGPGDGPATLRWPEGVSGHRLALRNAATGESFDGVVWADGRFDGDTLARLNAVMRDTHSGEVTSCDARLFVLLACVQAHVRKPFYILSGFRTPETNAALARDDPHVAPNSFHIRGMAADFCAEGVEPCELAQKAREVGAGGVGAGATFVHLDTGPMRSWAY